MPPTPLRLLGLLLAFAPPNAPAAGDEPGPRRLLRIRVAAGDHERRDSLLRFPIPVDRLGPEVGHALDAGPVAVRVVDPAAAADARPTIAELDRREDGSVRATWFLGRPIPARGEAAFDLDLERPAHDAPSPWSIATPEVHSSLRVKTDFRAVEVHRGDRTVFRYNPCPVEPPPRSDVGKTMGARFNLTRSAYIHPAYSPAGALITGDFSPFHPHHRGFFLAYVHTNWGEAHPDFWNIQDGTGRIIAVGADPPRLGPVTARLAARHEWQALGVPPGGNGMMDHTRTALRERWEIEVHDVPGSPYWLVDLTSTQQAVQHPLEILPYRYGGMAYRSAEPSVIGPVDVLTAEGRHRLDGDQRPTRWVDLAGPIAAGSPNYAGALIADHPSNPRYPTVARIHPITLPFFSFVPAHGEKLVIGVDRPTVFRYRIMIHDGRPDPALDDRIARDFADPAAVRVD